MLPREDESNGRVMFKNSPLTLSLGDAALNIPALVNNAVTQQ